MGRTNDAILFGGEVQLFVTGPEAEARELAAEAAQLGLARLRQAVRPDLRGRRARLLPDRSDAVQPGAGHGDLPRHRPHLHRAAGWRPTCWPSRSAMAPPDVLILGGRPEGWHGARLRRSAASAWASTSRGLDFRGLRLRRRRRTGVTLAGLAELPRAVLVRSIPAGSFEQVTLRLGLLHALEALGVPVVNDARAIERCVDKSMTSFLLARAGLPTPPTWVGPIGRGGAAHCASGGGRRASRSCSSRCSARRAAGLRLLDGGRTSCPRRRRSAASTTCSASSAGADDGWRDFRVFVIGGRAVAAMARRGVGWITNVGQGGEPEPAGGRGPARRARGGRGGCGRRRPCRRRPDRGSRRASCRSSRSTACRPGRACRA